MTKYTPDKPSKTPESWDDICRIVASWKEKDDRYVFFGCLRSVIDIVQSLEHGNTFYTDSVAAKEFIKALLIFEEHEGFHSNEAVEALISGRLGIKLSVKVLEEKFEQPAEGVALPITNILKDIEDQLRKALL